QDNQLGFVEQLQIAWFIFMSTRFRWKLPLQRPPSGFIKKVLLSANTICAD
ncbi:MAG: hypothetical protein ACI9ON_003326, partial [Limisphaerales bacterium]